MSRTKLQKLLNRLDGKNEKTIQAIKVFDSVVKQAREKLRQDISADNLDELNGKIKKLKESVDFTPVTEGLKVLEENFKYSVLNLLEEIENKDGEHKRMSIEASQNMDSNLESKSQELKEEIEELKKELGVYAESSAKQALEIGKNISGISEQMKKFAFAEELENIAEENGKSMKDMMKYHEEEMAKLQEALKKVRTELVSMIASKGGGNMNRKITMSGVDYLTKYTDINFKPGTGISFTVANNDTTKMVDFTITATGGPGGNTRVINTVSVSSVFGAASGTDYVAICNQGIQITMPTAVANTNLYTVKNTSNSSVLIATTGGQTIDDDANVILATKYTQIDLISDSANWNIT